MAGRRGNRPQEEPQPGMEGLMALLSQFNQAMARVEHVGAQPPQQRNNMALVDQFMRQRPPVFSGCTDPIKVEEWLASMEKIFEVLQCDEQEKYRITIYRLVGEANQWWEETKGTRAPEEVQAIDWEVFKDIFLN